MSNSPRDEITTRETLTILGYSDPSSVARLVAERKLKPARKLPGKTGAYLFRRGDVEKYAASREVAR